MKYSIFPTCEYCLRKMKTKYILCIPCELELCLKCFCLGVEGNNHLKTHNYRVEDVDTKIQDTILKNDSTWNYDDELELINAVGIYKTGNWTDIAAMVQTKSSEDCRRHFIDNYIESEFGRTLINDTSMSKNKTTTRPPFYDHTGGTSLPLLYERYPSSLMSADDEKCLGYLPRRNDFLVEYDDSAEKLICSIDPIQNSDNLISAIHVALIDMYNARVCLRNERKRVAHEHGLLYHLMARVLDRCPRDYNYFNRQLQRRVQPCANSGRNQSLFGRNYVHRQRSYTTITDHSSCAPSTPSDHDPLMVTPATPSSTSHQFFSPHSSELPLEERPFWHYNASMIDNSLKPFLRYMSSEDTKLFLDNIKAEETLKKEISTLQICVSHGIKNYQDYKSKLDAFNKHNDQSTNGRRKAPKRKRGRQRCFQFVYMMRKKRMEKYLDSLKPVGTK